MPSTEATVGREISRWFWGTSCHPGVTMRVAGDSAITRSSAEDGLGGRFASEMKTIQA